MHSLLSNFEEKNVCVCACTCSSVCEWIHHKHIHHDQKNNEKNKRPFTIIILHRFPYYFPYPRTPWLTQLIWRSVCFSYISFLNCIFSFFSSLSVIFNCWASGYFYCSINHPVKMFFQIQMVCNTLQIHILVFFLIFRLFKKVCKRRIIITKINLAYSSGQAK